MTRILLLLLALLLCAAPARAEVWASSKSKVYHKKLCRWMGKVKPEYRFSFATPLAARKAGYQPCGTCRPPGVELGETAVRERKK